MFHWLHRPYTVRHIALVTSVVVVYSCRLEETWNEMSYFKVWEKINDHFL